MYPLAPVHLEVHLVHPHVVNIIILLCAEPWSIDARSSGHGGDANVDGARVCCNQPVHGTLARGTSSRNMALPNTLPHTQRACAYTQCAGVQHGGGHGVQVHPGGVHPR